jgi:hypothetical protein
MAAGSIAGTSIGGRLTGIVPGRVLVPLLLGPRDLATRRQAGRLARVAARSALAREDHG